MRKLGKLIMGAYEEEKDGEKIYRPYIEITRGEDEDALVFEADFFVKKEDEILKVHRFVLEVMEQPKIDLVEYPEGKDEPDEEPRHS